MHIQGASFCCLCLKTNDSMFGCVECVRLESGLKSSKSSPSPSSFCSASCYQTHFGACHRVSGVSEMSKRCAYGSRRQRVLPQIDDVALSSTCFIRVHAVHGSIMISASMASCGPVLHVRGVCCTLAMCCCMQAPVTSDLLASGHACCCLMHTGPAVAAAALAVIQVARLAAACRAVVACSCRLGHCPWPSTISSITSTTTPHPHLHTGGAAGMAGSSTSSSAAGVRESACSTRRSGAAAAVAGVCCCVADSYLRQLLL